MKNKPNNDANNAATKPEEIDLAAFTAALHDPATVVLDAQGPGLFTRAHVPAAIPIDWYNIDADLREHASAGTDTRVVIYCTDNACTGSAIAAEHLISRGWSNVARFPGGLAEWTSNRPLQAPNAAPSKTSDTPHP